MLETEICEAISSKNLIQFTYSGSARVVEPHLFGIGKNGVATLSAWQRGGASGEGWRGFHINKISAFELLDEHFEEVRPDAQLLRRALLQILAGGPQEARQGTGSNGRRKERNRPGT